MRCQTGISSFPRFNAPARPWDDLPLPGREISRKIGVRPQLFQWKIEAWGSFFARLFCTYKILRHAREWLAFGACLNCSQSVTRCPVSPWALSRAGVSPDIHLRAGGDRGLAGLGLGLLAGHALHRAFLWKLGSHTDGSGA